MLIRNLQLYEKAPDFKTGFESLAIDPNWAWVAEENGNKWGILLAAPCHGLVYLARLCVADGAPVFTAAWLLRHFIRDCNERGYKAYFTHVDPTNETERQFIGFCRKSEGIQATRPQVLIAGSFEKAGKY
jgi:hypothetical protein